jgi:RND family efflux transporter MFP subunit
MKNKILPIIAIICIVFAVFIVNQQKPSSEKTSPVKEPASIAKTEHNFIAANGVIEAASEEIHVASNKNGIVSDVFVAPNVAVKKDDPLFLIDNRASLARREIAQSEIEVAKANLETAKNRLNFYEKIKNQEAIAKEELVNRKNAFLTAKANLVAAESKFNEAQIDLDLHLTSAPIDGQILKVNVKKGEYAKSPSDLPLIVIADISNFNVRVEVDEFNIAKIKPNMTATITPRGTPDIKLKASFVRIEPLVEAKRNLRNASKELIDTRILQVIFKIEEANSSIYAGQQVDVYIKNE